LLWLFWRRGLLKLFAQLALNHNLSLLSS
jgi:hypothetical protein